MYVYRQCSRPAKLVTPFLKGKKKKSMAQFAGPNVKIYNAEYRHHPLRNSPVAAPPEFNASHTVPFLDSDAWSFRQFWTERGHEWREVVEEIPQLVISCRAMVAWVSRP